LAKKSTKSERGKKRERRTTLFPAVPFDEALTIANAIRSTRRVKKFGGLRFLIRSGSLRTVVPVGS